MKTEVSRAAPYELKYFKYSSHYWILKFLAVSNRPLRILDVGTANGYLGAILGNLGHSIVGVEKDPNFATKAARFYQSFHITDIETFEFPFKEEFDLILFADVLEHLRDPSMVLKRSMKCLKHDGEIILSVPNVANFTVRGCLLFGRFNYRRRGILDETHLRFYTLATLRQLLNECGLKPLECVGTPVPVQLMLPFTNHRVFFPLHEMHYAMVRAWKALMAYQFVLRAVPL